MPEKFGKYALFRHFSHNKKIRFFLKKRLTFGHFWAYNSQAVVERDNRLKDEYAGVLELADRLA
jgi:hypothetical protein